MYLYFFLCHNDLVIIITVSLSEMTLYPSSRSSNCILSIYVVILINLQKKKRPVKNMGKNFKSYATTQSISPGKGREVLWQKVQIFWLKYGMA